MNTLRRTNMSPKKGTIWIGKDHLPTIIFQGIFVSFQGGITYVVPGFPCDKSGTIENQQFLTLARREDFGIARLVVLVPLLLKIQVQAWEGNTFVSTVQRTCKRRGKTGLGVGMFFFVGVLTLGGVMFLFDSIGCHFFKGNLQGIIW